MDLFDCIEKCRACNLCHNQPPLIQKTKSADVFWVGISAVKTQNLQDIPLSDSTNSGKLIGLIESTVNNAKFHKTNLVKCLPVDNESKIRYPSITEMHNCYSHIEKEINKLNPNIIVLLGRQVASYVLKKNCVANFNLDSDFQYEPIHLNGRIFLPVHHPSYVLVYKRKRLAVYCNSIASLLNYATSG